MKIFHGIVLSGLAIASSSTLAAPAGVHECLPQVQDGWVRLGPAGMPMMAGFGRIENHCRVPMTIVGAGSPAFGSVELHETRIVDGVNRMRPVPELRIPADGTAVLEPGGMHLMLMQPRAPLKAGDKVTLTFELTGGGELTGEFTVRKPDAL